MIFNFCLPWAFVYEIGVYKFEIALSDFDMQDSVKSRNWSRNLWEYQTFRPRKMRGSSSWIKLIYFFYSAIFMSKIGKNEALFSR